MTSSSAERKTWLDNQLNITHTFPTRLYGTYEQIDGFQTDYIGIKTGVQNALFVITVDTAKKFYDKQWLVEMEIEIVTQFPRNIGVESETVVTTFTHNRSSDIVKWWRFAELRLKLPYGDVLFITVNIKIRNYEGLPNPKRLIENAQKMLQSADLRLELEGGSIDVNRFVLTSKSKAFEKLFNSAENNQGVIVIHDVDFKKFLQFIGLMYGIKPDLRSRVQRENGGGFYINYYSTFEYLMELCVRLDAPSTRSKLVNTVENVPFDEFLPFLKLSEKYNCPQIQKRIVDCMTSRSQLEMLETQEFAELSHSTKNFVLRNVVLKLDRLKTEY